MEIFSSVGTRKIFRKRQAFDALQFGKHFNPADSQASLPPEELLARLILEYEKEDTVALSGKPSTTGRNRRVSEWRRVLRVLRDNPGLIPAIVPLLGQLSVSEIQPANRQHADMTGLQVNAVTLLREEPDPFQIFQSNTELAELEGARIPQAGGLSIPQPDDVQEDADWSLLESLIRQSLAAETLPAGEAGTPDDPEGVRTPGGKPLKGLTLNKTLLPDPDGPSMGGPVAALAMAHAMGRNADIAEVKTKALTIGWTAERGMPGIDGQRQLLEAMHIPTRQEQPVQWDKVQREVEAGRPVIIATEATYLVVEGFNPATGQFDFGNSARSLTDVNPQGNTLFTPQALPDLNKGSPLAAFYLEVPPVSSATDNPQGLSTKKHTNPYPALRQNWRTKDGRPLSREFVNRAAEIAVKYGGGPNDLLGTIGVETAGTYDPRIHNGFGYYGLGQMSVSNIQNLGYSLDQYLAMSDVEQLDVLDAYYAWWMNIYRNEFSVDNPRLNNPGLFYLIIAAPGTLPRILQDPAADIYAQGSIEHASNPLWHDPHNNGRITLRRLQELVEERIHIYSDPAGPSEVSDIRDTQPGQAPVLPAPPPDPSPGDEATRVHAIRSGEMLSLIARHYQVPEDAIWGANLDKIPDKNLIAAGDEILIPLSPEAQRQALEKLDRYLASHAKDAPDHVDAAIEATTPPSEVSPPSAEMPAKQTVLTPSGLPLAGITPNQLQFEFSPDWASHCGLVATMAMGRTVGLELTMDQIRATARENTIPSGGGQAVLWNNERGMAGPHSLLKLMELSGINAELVEGSPDWDRVRREVQAGRAVVIGTQPHYMVVEGYDEATGRFDFGNSLRIFSALQGETWYTPEELQTRVGATLGASYGQPLNAIYLDASQPVQISQPEPSPLPNRIVRWDPATGKEGFVDTLYWNLFGHAPTPRHAVRGWVSHWERHGLADVIQGFFDSEEMKGKHHTAEQTTELLYRAVFQRHADPQGKRDVTAQIMRGRAPGQIARDFFGSNEYALSGSRSPDPRADIPSYQPVASSELPAPAGFLIPNPADPARPLYKPNNNYPVSFETSGALTQLSPDQMPEDLRGFLKNAVKPVAGYTRLSGQNPAEGHWEGVDLGANIGTPIQAIAPGRVAQTGFIPVGGFFVIIDHLNGYYSYYGHLLEPSALKVDERVEAGQQLGRMGSTGYTVSRIGAVPHEHPELGPVAVDQEYVHLHFEIRKGGLMGESQMIRELLFPGE